MSKSAQSDHLFTVLFITASLLAWMTPVMANPMGQAELQFDRPGGDYHNFKANSFSQCATSCATIAQCRAYTFVNETKICWLKDAVPKRVANNCCVSGIKIMGAPEINVDRPGADIRPGFDVSIYSSECEDACKKDPQCRAYTLVKPGIQGESAKCWLKNAKPAKVQNACCISAVKLTTPPARRIQQNTPLRSSD